MLKVENIIKKYGENVAVNNLSFTVDAGEIFGLLGENGAGKTTTFRIIMGLIDANEGKVTLDGKKIDYSETDNIGFVTEERSLLTKLTVQEQIEFYGTIKELSKGNQQKIQFISAIINEPKLLILDEPFTGLDPINVKLMKDAIYYLKEKGCSIIFSSHQMEYIEDFCEKLILLVKGNTILDGKLDDIKENYAKKNIMIKGEDIDISAIKKLKGVISVEKTRGELEVKIANKEVAPKVFDIIKNSNITKYDVVSPSLNEIFIASVGGIHE